MKNSIILSTPLIIVLLIIALFLMLVPQFIKREWLSLTAYIVSFLCVAASITYGLLLGAVLDEILIVIMAFALIALFSFLPKAEKKDVDNQQCFGTANECAIDVSTSESTNPETVQDTINNGEAENEF